MISMHIEECQASELRRKGITAQSPRFSRWMLKDNEFGSNPSLDPSLSCAFGIKKEVTYSGRAYKTEIFKSLHWTKYYSVNNDSC